MSTLTQAMIVNVAVLAAVLATDLGPARKIGLGRILRPLIVAAAIVPLFVAKPDTGSTNVAMELGGTVLGILCGLGALALMRVYRGTGTGTPVTRAGWGYATLWTVVIGGRAIFSYGCAHWWPTQLVHWAITHHATANALTDGLVFMAIAMLVTRTLGVAARATALNRSTATMDQ